MQLALAKEVRTNLRDLMKEWYQTEEGVPLLSQALADQQLLLVHRTDLDKLATEAMMLREFVLKILSPDYTSALAKLTSTEQELHRVTKDRNLLESEKEQLARKAEGLMVDFEQEKQEKSLVKNELVAATHQLAQQAEYCSTMGASCSTLLWRVSKHEESIHSLLSGSKVNEFFQLVGETVTSYISIYHEGFPSEETEETQFVLALCGTVTNIAASAYGREYLSSSSCGLDLVDVLCGVLVDIPHGQGTKLKNLCLMALYNVSINQKGLTHLSLKPNLIGDLVWVLKESRDVVTRQHALRLLQSMVLEPASELVTQQLLRVIPLELLHVLSSDPHHEVNTAALELMADMQALCSGTK